MCVFVCERESIGVCVFICVCVLCVREGIGVCVHMCVCGCVRLRVYEHRCVCVHMYVCAHVSVCVCVCASSVCSVFACP